ncbi:MAG: alpha/beta hydrolase [Deltaproteobacteria bacterium]|nr:alpha/beta hydrolase [Deltaproteobacteria bacterium]
MAFMTPEQWRAGGDHFLWRGEQIFFRVEGTGEPLLLIHGFPTASWDWFAVWPALIERYRVLTLDMIGFGFSAKPRGFDYSIFAQADLFEALLARHHVKTYRLLAHDYGLTVTQELLARQGDAATTARITSACLLNGGLFPETHRALVTQRLLASPLGPLVARVSSYRTFASTMRRIWGAHPPSDAELRAMWQLVTENGGLGVMAKLIGYMAERKRHRERWVRALVESTLPIRLVNGLADPVSGAHMVARYRELVPHPDIVELPGVGHYPQLEAPDAVLAAALELFSAATS